MKGMIIAVLLLLSFGSYSFAQTTPVKAKKTTAATSTTTKATTKKDGSADMRYKANKDSAKAKAAAVHVKKDGTADKRFKENKKK